MVTNYPHPVASNEAIRTTADEAQGEGFSVMDRVRQMFCGLHGHDNLLQFEQDRMFLKCVSCGHESPGWELVEASPSDLSGHVPQRVPSPPPLVQPRPVA